MPSLRSAWRARWTLLPARVALVSVVAVTAAVPAQVVGSGWERPVPGAVVRPYREPISRFASGHRGVDFAAAPGTPVRASNDGRVTFAGSVAGALHVVVAHAGGIRTSSSFLSRVDVRVGATVRRGDVVGVAGGSGEGHGAGVLHFGARIGDRYIDPMLLFGPTDLTELVRLVPANERAGAARASPDDEARALEDEFRAPPEDHCAGGLLGAIPGVDEACEAVSAGVDAALDAAEWVGGAVPDAVEWLADRGEDAIGLAIDALRAAGDAAAAIADVVADIVLEVQRTIEAIANGVVSAVKTLARLVAEGAAAIYQAVVEVGLYLLEHLTSCPQPPAAAHPKGSGNDVIAVGGLSSSRRATANDELTKSFTFPVRRLGYAPDDVIYHSYRADSPTYAAEDTYGDLHAQARALSREIKEWARAHPGEKLDLVGHSQGGVIIDLFLTEVYRGHESEYPPIENVVTFASPHEGTPLADLEVTVQKRQKTLSAALDVLGADLPLGARSISQLGENSPTIKNLWRNGGVPRGIRYLSIAGAADPVVPSDHSDVPGGTKIVVTAGNPLPFDDHSAVLRDDDAISAAQAHLEGGHPANSCGLLVDAGAKLYSALVRRATSKLAVPLELRVALSLLTA